MNVPAEISFKEQLNEWKKKFDQCLVSVWYPDETWKESKGLITEKIRRSLSNNGVALMCGPDRMLEPVVEELEKIGIGEWKTYVSLERMMRYGVGKCGHCSLGDKYICKDGPVFTYGAYRRLLGK